MVLAGDVTGMLLAGLLVLPAGTAAALQAVGLYLAGRHLAGMPVLAGMALLVGMD